MTDELVNGEFDHCNDFDDDVSIQTSNTNLNNQLEWWQGRNEETESLYDLDSNSESEDGMDSSAYHITLANNNDVNNNNMYQVWGNVHQVNEKVCEHILQEDHLLIRLTALCCNANVPLYLANEIVEIFVMKQNVVWFWTQFCCQRDELLWNICVVDFQILWHNLSISKLKEYTHWTTTTNVDFIIVFFDFLEQVNDLLNDASIFGNMSNFVGMINISDPFSNKAPCNDGLIDEVHNAKWYHDTIKICHVEAKGEPYMLLPIIGYIDKTGTNINQRNKLEPFSFTLSILNRSCHFTSKAWRVLGFIPDLNINPLQQSLMDIVDQSVKEKLQ